MIDLIAVDLDGTFLIEETKISEENLAAVRAAQSQGIEVVIATGRASFDVQEIFKDLNLNTWVISANGACIHDPEGNMFHSVPLDKTDALQILKWLEKHGFYYEAFSKDAILTLQNGRDILSLEKERLLRSDPEADPQYFDHVLRGQFSQNGFTYIKDHTEAADPDIDIFNILAFSLDIDKLHEGRNHFINRHDLTLVSSGDHNFELEHLEASKGLALEKLAHRLDIDLARTAAVGDSFNDLSMLKVAGKSAAMGNAPRQVKEAAQTVTLTNKEDGAAQFIRSLL